jgi:hypothetical protein
MGVEIGILGEVVEDCTNEGLGFGVEVAVAWVLVLGDSGYAYAIALYTASSLKRST